MALMIDYMEIVIFCIAFYLYHFVAIAVLPVKKNIMLKHCREKAAAIFLNRYFLAHLWHHTYKITEET